MWDMTYSHVGPGSFISETFIGKAVFKRHLFMSRFGTKCGPIQNIGPHCVLLIAVRWQRSGAAEALVAVSLMNEPGPTCE